MAMSKKKASLHGAKRKLWKIRIMTEKGYTENCAGWMVQRVEELIDYMQYGCALVAYHRQDGTFKLVKATLLPYREAFRKEYDILNVTGTVIYWDIDLQAWRSFLIENFLEWRQVAG